MLERLYLPAALLQDVRLHAEAAYPGECCGFLLGGAPAGGDARVVEAVEPLANPAAAEGALDRYRIEPGAYLRADRRARAKGWDILGCYHSHPDAEAVPSAVDAACAWPWYAYLIVAVRGGRAAEARGWVLNDAAGDPPRFHEIRIEDV